MSNHPTSQIVRPPIIVVMGHIDHGKSTLLDYIRKANVAASEAGGITQAVSAYEVTRPKDGTEMKITFIDTPGHAAFTSMRERGASIADIAILVVSAEDGVKPQTLEALKAIESAQLPYVVAINKIDRPNANIERTKQSLAENNILVESYGGKIPSVDISAKTGEGVDDLLDMLLLVAELGDYQADPSQPASGFVLEANRDPKQGVTATLMIKNGTLRVGDFVVAEQVTAKVKRLNTFAGQQAAELTVSAPAQVIGFTELPPVGASFASFGSKKEAEKFAAAASAPKAKSEKSLPLAGTAEQAVIPVFIKTAVAGAADAVELEVLKQQTEAVKIAIIGSGVGQVSEGDVKLASGSRDTIILGFNVDVHHSATDLAEKLGITIQTFDIIYKLSEWLAEEVARRTPKVQTEQVVGQARILKYFSAARSKQVIGGQVTLGVIHVGKPVKILRRDAEIGRGKIMELQHAKMPVKEVEAEKQFGAMIDAKITLAPGDTIEVVELVEQ